MKKDKGLLHSNLLLVGVAILGMALRLSLQYRGYNYDFDSFVIVTKIISSGGNVYLNTPRYNYGPIWFNVLNFLFHLASKDIRTFRYMLVVFLGLVDFFISIILYKKVNKVAGYIFFLNPISIIITGYHNQFDNLAILLGMLSVTIIGNDYEEGITRRKLFGLLVMGLSITTKHILFMFPLWLAIKQKGIRQKLITIFVPSLVFILSFIPYWHDGRQGIIQNVFLYESFDNAYFYKLFVPYVVQVIFTSKVVWIIILVVFSFVFRKVDGFNSLLLYTCVLVVTSPAITNQYLAIVMPFVVTHINPFTIAYTLVGTYHLFIDQNGLHIYDKVPDFTTSYSHIFYPALIFLLGLGFVNSVWSNQVLALMNKIRREIKIQLGYDI